jgi:hypothetical protein
VLEDEEEPRAPLADGVSETREEKIARETRGRRVDHFEHDAGAAVRVAMQACEWHAPRQGSAQIREIPIPIRTRAEH